MVYFEIEKIDELEKMMLENCQDKSRCILAGAEYGEHGRVQ